MCAGAINAENMLVSGGSVTIRECTALCGGSGGVGRFLGPGTGDEG